MLDTLCSGRLPSLLVLACVAAVSGCAAEVSEDESAVGVVRQQLPGGVVTVPFAWLRSESQTGASGASVTSWTDSGGGMRNASSVTNGGGSPQRPTVQLNVANYHRAVRFSDPAATPQRAFLRIGSAPPSGDMTMIAVFATTQVDTGNEFHTAPALLGAEADSGSDDLALGLAAGQVFMKAESGDAFGARSSTAFNDGVPHIALGTRVRNGNQVLHIDGAQVALDASDNALLDDPTGLGIGNHQNGENGGQLAGDIAEVLVYGSAVTAGEQQRIESYLALKYGITLAKSYLDSGARTVWTSGAGYDHDIAGLGRDDASLLDQRVARSVNADNVVSMALQNDFTAENTAATRTTQASNFDFTVWGNDNGALAFSGAVTVAGQQLRRYGRVWKVQESNTDGSDPGSLFVRFDHGSITLGRTYCLLADDDANFGNGGTTLGACATAASAATVGLSADFNDTSASFFTLAEYVPPAGVQTPLAVWLRADGSVYSSGTTQAANDTNVATWVDSSPRTNNATQATASAQPTFSSVAANFNPAVHFARDATDSTFLDTGALGIPATAGSTHVLVMRVTATTAPGAIGDALGDFVIDRPTATPELTSFKLIDVAGQNRLAYQKRTNAGANIGGPTATGAPVLGGWRIVQYERNRGVAYNLYFEGKLESSLVDADGDTTPPPLRLGRHATNGGGGFTGDIAEVLAFGNALTTAERRQVQSFLALKYGITLDQSAVLLNDGTGDYFDSSGTVIFDAHSGAAVNPYNKAIAGIGRDVVSALAQKQSSGAGDVVTIGLESIAVSNAANPATFASDRTFLVWGHDGAALTRTQTGAPSARVRLSRIWRAKETGGDLADVDVAWNTSPLSLPPTTAADYRLLLDAGNTDFADATSVTASSFAAGVATFSAVDVDDGVFFTFGLLDTDSDGTSDAEEDSNADGNRNNDDADSDGTPNFQDPSNADACIPSAIVTACPTGDSDGDGTLNGVDSAPSDPCVPNGNVLVCSTGDTDGDGTLNDADAEPSNACVPNANALTCASGDADGDGTLNGTDEAPSNPCLPNADAQACPTADSDGDGLLNDADSAPSNPCLPNADALACPTADSDGDGTLNGADSAPSNPCLPNANALACASGDLDGDGALNGADTAPSDPCVPNANALTCASGDLDGDGALNGVDTAPSDPCAPNPDALACLTGDTDDDGIDNATDGEPENPCAPEADAEACPTGDSDDDGTSNMTDSEPLNACVPNADAVSCPTGDADHDGVPNAGDTAASDPCEPNANAVACPTGDSDGDGVDNGPDPAPSDACDPNADVLACQVGDFDGDGIANGVECPNIANCPDSDGDGDPDFQDTDSDGDALLDMLECTDDSACEDTDADGLASYRESDTLDTDDDGAADADDTDSDGDGSDDGVECSVLPCADVDSDGIPDFLDAADAGPGSGDSDQDGRDDAVECPSGYLCPDSDDDLVPDYTDTDSDDDGSNDMTDTAPLDPCLPDGNTPACAAGDSDGDGVPNATDPAPTDACNPSAVALACATGDADSDGIANAVECSDRVAGTNGPCPDSDADGTLDYLDLDSDGDGELDAAECPDDSSCVDTDTDGLPDFVESGVIDSDGSGESDENDSDADGDGTADGVECAAQPCPDADSDEIPDHLDRDSVGPDPGDSDDDGYDDEIECPSGYPCVDSDRDAVPDYADTDSDGDGALDDVDADRLDPCLPNANSVTCASGDNDGDGEPNDTDSAPTDPCLPNGDALACATGDSDGDGYNNTADSAPEDPCLPEANAVACATGDYDGDGTPNATDPEPQEECVPNMDALLCDGGDADGDGTTNENDTDSADPCAPSADVLACASSDADGDGTPNGTDSAPEDPCAPDADAVACASGDADGDGVRNETDSAPSNPCMPSSDVAACAGGDTDGDGVDNDDDSKPQDPCVPNADAVACDSGDADDDGVDNDDDGKPEDPCVPDASALACDSGDADDDGVDNDDDAQPENPCVPDADALACDSGDADDDGVDNVDDAEPEDACVPDADALACGSGDVDGDGVANADDEAPDDPCLPVATAEACGEPEPGDEDGDGVTDAVECPSKPCRDTDRDGDPDRDDADDDGDGIPTARERGDANDDGVPDYLQPAGKISGGALCSAQPGTRGGDFSTLGALLVLGAALRLRRSRRAPQSGHSARGRSPFAAVLGLLTGLLIGLLAAAPVRAQVALEQLKPAPLASDGFALSRPTVLDGADWDLLLVFDYANDPLVFETEINGESEEERIVEHHLVAHVGAGFALAERVALFASLPVHLLMEGDDSLSFPNQEPEGAGIGDVSLGARLRIAGEAEDVAALGLEFIARLPTAELANDQQQYSGDEVGSYEPALLGELRAGVLSIQLRAGARLRKEVTIGDLDLGPEFVFGAGLRLKVAGELYLHGELYGSTHFTDAFDEEHTPVELLAGPKLRAGAVVLGAAAGPGLVRGYGSPDVRVVATFAVAPIPEKPAERPPQPEMPGDMDGDGLVDVVDRCPREAEDMDDYEDGDGCPDLDHDGDGVLEPTDSCPEDAEDKDGFEDGDGCPDPDNDKDGLLDGDDQCPTEAEDADKFKDEDGCPDPDNDGDGVPDTSDDCPLAPGSADNKGCPKSVRFDAEKGEITILDRVEFATGKDTLLPSAFPILQEVQSTLNANPQVVRLRVEGHTDSVGRDAKNLDLSKRRARSVARWLIERGTPGDRLEAYGCGENLPIADNKTKDGKQQNRRVEFHVVDPQPAAPRPAAGCEPITL